MAEIIMAISLWCGAVGYSTPILDKETKECAKALFKCVRKNVTCSSCWSISVPVPVYDSALGRCIEESL